MREKIQALKFAYEIKIKLIDVDLDNFDNENQEIRLLIEQKSFRKFVSELEEVLIGI